MSRAGSGGEMDGDFRKKREQQLRDLENAGIDPFDEEGQDPPPKAPTPDYDAVLAAVSQVPYPNLTPSPPPSDVLEIDRTITIPIAMPLSTWTEVINVLCADDLTQPVGEAIALRIKENIMRIKENS